MSGIEKPVVCVSASVEEMAKPDIAEFIILFRGQGQDQAACAKKYAADAKRAKEALEPLGLDDELKLSNCSSYANRRRGGRISGSFEYYTRGSLRVRLSEKDITAIWTAPANKELKASINVRFSLEDEDVEEVKLLERVVTKARGSAEVLATASGKRLDEVRQIRYNRPIDWSSLPRSYGVSAGPCVDDPGPTPDSNYMPTPTPEPIEVTCEADMDWWLA